MYIMVQQLPQLHDRIIHPKPKFVNIPLFTAILKRICEPMSSYMSQNLEIGSGELYLQVYYWREDFREVGEQKCYIGLTMIIF